MFWEGQKHSGKSRALGDPNLPGNGQKNLVSRTKCEREGRKSEKEGKEGRREETRKGEEEKLVKGEDWRMKEEKEIMDAIVMWISGCNERREEGGTKEE